MNRPSDMELSTMTMDDNLSGYFLNSGVLYRMAIKAYERTREAPSDTAKGQDDALTALLFCAATLEAFIAELSLHAQRGTRILPSCPQVTALANVLDEAEAGHSSVRLKYLIAKAVLSGHSCNKGTKPYQDFELLFSIRDAIVHHKPEKTTRQPNKIVAALATRKLCEPENFDMGTSWLTRIATRGVARWSCNVVCDVVFSIRECFPADAEKTTNPFTPMVFACRHYERVG